MNDWLVLLFPAAFLLVGAVLLGVGLRSRSLARASQQWPSTPGKVTRSDVEVTEDRDSDGRESRMYTAKVEYEYALGASQYRGSRIRFGLGGSGNQSFVQGLVDRYPVGAAVDVYYDPEKPDRCTLDRSGGSGTFLVVFGAIFLIVGLLVGGLLWGLRSRKPGGAAAALEGTRVAGR